MIMENSEKLWTGEVPNNWKFYKGKYIFGERSERGNSVNLQLLSPTQKFGVIPQSMYDELTSMKSVKVREDTDLSTFRTIHRGDFCISLRSFQGGFEYSEYEGVVSPAYHVLYPKMNICAGYYKYLFKEQRFIGEMNSYCQSLRDGKNISYFDFGRTLIPFPPLSEQQAIADYLDETCSKIDEIIAEAKISIDEYTTLKQALIAEITINGLNKNIDFCETNFAWMGKIPTHWELKPFKYVLNERNEKNNPIKSTERLSLSIDKGITLYAEKTTNLNRFKDDFTAYKLAYKGDLVMNSMNMIVGASGVSDYFGCVSPVYYTYFDNEPDHITAKYCEYLFRSRMLMRVLRSLGRGIHHIDRGDDRVNTCRLKVSRDDLRALVLPVPPLCEQREIVDFLDKRTAEIDSLITEKESLINDLEAYKKSLIYEVVTGKRRVV